MHWRFTLLLLAALHADAHAPVIPAIRGPLQTRGNLLLDNNGGLALLRGLTMPGLEVLDPTPGTVDALNVAAMTKATFGVMRVRWNMNAVRLPVSIAAWQRDGSRYLDRVEAIVKLANEADLAVVLAAQEDERSGSPASNGLPGAGAAAFWTAWASRFKDNPRIIFSVFREPSARNIPDSGTAGRTSADWLFWLNGGTGRDGQRAYGMQELVDAIRATAAQQVIAVPAFHDRFGFQGLTAANMIRGANILYEIHPYFDVALTFGEREAAFGFLTSQVPVYAGEWGFPLRDAGRACLAVPRDVGTATQMLLDTGAYFDSRAASWTASAFQPGSLILDLTDFQPTVLDRLWNCGEIINPQPGLGEILMLLRTGDPSGFGALRSEQLANAAGGPATPVAPGQLLSIYAEQLGPDPGAAAQFGSDGKLPLNLGGTEVFFDGVPAPLLYAGAFQINIQVPYSLQPGKTSVLQVFFRGVPSNRLNVDVVEAAPELFYDVLTRHAIAVNEDGSRNGPANPAASGAIVVLFGSGGGQTTPAGDSGAPAGFPHPRLTLPLIVTVDGQTSETLFAGEVPGFTGLLQINARLPQFPPSSSARPVPLVIRVGNKSSRAPVLLWVR